MGTGLPLPSLLSYALCAYTIEVDNGFERRMPVFTKINGLQIPREGPDVRPVWPCSLMCWSNGIRHVDEAGTLARQVADRSGFAGLPGHPELKSYQRWGYLTIGEDLHTKKVSVPKGDAHVSLTRSGRAARAAWLAIPAEVDARWEERLGKRDVDDLRLALQAVTSRLDVPATEHFPGAHLGGACHVPAFGRTVPDVGTHLAVPLSAALLAFTLDYEQEAPLPMAFAANVVRVIAEDGTPTRDVPRLTGLAKDQVATVVRNLQKGGYLTSVPDPAKPRAPLAKLTPKGLDAQDAHTSLLASTTAAWRDRFGASTVGALVDALDVVVGAAHLEESRLRPGLELHPGGWRAKVPQPDTLPHHPFNRQGGYPDGA